jgi:thymidylate synthase (FAD)
MKFSSEIPVELIAAEASDARVVQAARVSTQGAASEAEESEGLVRFLLKNRHMTPFEHNLFTFRVMAPIFVWREHHRHRIGFSYNEESGRYKQLDPHFYIPHYTRNLVQVGKPGHYTFEPGTPEQLADVHDAFEDIDTEAYKAYEHLLGVGIAREVARMVLPVNIFSTCYVSCNARSLMSFLSLRTKDEDSTFPSFPQHEIEMVARQYETILAEHMPITYKAFCDFGRVGG